MNRYEKNVMKLMEAHEKIPKVVLITNVNQAILDSGIRRSGKNKWVCQITGAPMGTVCTWFSKAKCRALNKMPVYAMCQIAVALKVPVWKLLENPGDIHEMPKPKIDRKGRLYWYIRRNEAERLWNETYSQSEGDWKTQGKKKQREFWDRLYLERINKQEMEETENEQTTY